MSRSVRFPATDSDTSCNDNESLHDQNGYKMTASLDGKVILLTGGATGIGRQTALQLALAGAVVAIGDLNIEGATSVAADITSRGGVADAFSVDISDEDQVRRFVEHVVDKFGGIDGVFSNAADLSQPTIGADTNIVDNSPENWHHTLAVNLTGTYFVLRHTIPILLGRGGGPIVCTASEGALIGDGIMPAYCVSKAGISVLIRHTAAKWGKQGIRANAVAPGLILTEAADAALPSDTRDGWLAKSPSARLGKPSDVASMVEYLLSDESEWVTGQTFSVNGGSLMR